MSERAGRKWSAEGGGFAGSLLLHLCAALLVFLFIEKGPHIEPTALKIVPIDLVLGSGGPEGESATTPHPAAPRVSRIVARATAGVTPRSQKPPPDELETRLESLAKLKSPDTDPRLQGAAATPGDPSSGNGGEGNYTVRDYVRAQVERHWNPDVATLGARNYTILIHIVMTGGGDITRAEIVDRDTGDVAYRSLALSARNAVLLASPIVLPPGHYDKVMDITLALSPRQILR